MGVIRDINMNMSEASRMIGSRYRQHE